MKDEFKNDYCKNKSINLIRVPYTIDTKEKIKGNNFSLDFFLI